MIINENNKDSAVFKGKVLRGFNNTPTSIRDNIEKSKQTFENLKQNINTTPKQEPKITPGRQRELMTKINRINK